MNTQILEGLTLARGGHRNREEGICLLEAAAWVAGEQHTDEPDCVSTVLGTFGRALNDVLPDDRRQQLLPLAPRLVGTADHPEADQRAGLMAADWLIRNYTPAWLRLAGLAEFAERLADLAQIDSWDDVEAAQALLNEVRDGAAAAGAAAWDAARAAAWDAARDAARDAAGDAAWAAAWAAARAALQPTVSELQDDAIELFERMIGCYEPQAS